jgi:RNA 3'-terminal phosphate cyclase (ATP)
MTAVITIDGSEGEGGGQVLRTSLALSLATGAPFRIENIRAQRPKPGLLRQHLTAVQAAAAVGRARVEGNVPGSPVLTFTPTGVYTGDYSFSVGTAGSATLVLQTILPPLLVAGGRTMVTLEGGTHNPWAPPFDYLEQVFLPVVNRLGPRVEVVLERCGFYPAGGGRFSVTIDPSPQLARLELCDRGEIVGRRLRSLVAHLPRHIGEREVATARGLLNWSEESARVEVVANSPGPGNVLLVEIESEHVTEICTGFGETGTPAETVADRAVRDARRYLAAGVPVGCHLADQLLPILALGGGGSFRTLTPSRHMLTNADVVRQFVNVEIVVTPETRDIVRVDVAGRALP